LSTPVTTVPDRSACKVEDLENCTTANPYSIVHNDFAVASVYISPEIHFS
jgi:hypothetical protein